MVRILVVEDESEIRTSIVDMLELDNHEVIDAPNGEIGLKLAKQHIPDLIISDIMMPIMDGHQLFTALKGHFATAHIPFIFLTAMVNYDNVREGMDLGADDYLTKPFDYHQLSRAVNARLNKHAFEEQIRLQQFAQQLVALQERERKLITGTLESDIQEPFSGLKMMLNMVLQSQDLSQLQTAVHLAEDITHQIEALSLRLSPTMIDQLNIVSVLIWLCEQYKQRYQLKIQFDRTGFTPQLPNSTKMGIYRIFDEILSNVVHHAQTDEIKIQLSIKDDLFRLEVWDNGVGFDIQDVLQGNTVGIRTLYEHAALLSGELNIHSIKNKGTYITLEMPVVSVENPILDLHATLDRNAMQSPKSLSTNQIRVIVADDHDLIRHGLRQLFSQDETIIEVGEASSNIELLQVIHKHDVDVVIMDMMLGEAGSFDLIRSIVHQHPHIQIIVFSNYMQEVYAVEALRSGANGYLLKDTNSLEIISAIHKVAEGEQYVCEAMADKVMSWMLNTRTDTTLDIYQTLTTREREIMLLVVEGYTSNEVAQKLAISPRTVEKHRSNLMTKLGLKTPTQLIRFAVEHGLIKN